MTEAQLLQKGNKRLARVAERAGVSKDQIANFVNAGYVPQPKQLKFHGACRLADYPGGPVDIAFGGARGGGKALAIDTLIPTPEGWKTMGDIQPGDYVFNPDGKPIRVIGCSKTMLNHNCAEVEFSDGSIIVADEDHLLRIILMMNANSCME